jgi:hypothetical protein
LRVEEVVVLTLWSVALREIKQGSISLARGKLTHVTDTAKIHVIEAFVINDAMGRISQTEDLPSSIFIRVVEDEGLVWPNSI